MKKLVAAILATASIAANAHESVDTTLVFKGDLSYASFCRAAAEDNVRLMRNSFKNKIGVVAGSKRDTMKILLDSNNLSCNGVGIVEFSKQREAKNVVAFLEETAMSL